MLSAAQLLKQARQRAGLTQLELARRAGVTQSVISVYEGGRRQPSLTTLSELIAATGHRLDIEVVPLEKGPIARRLSDSRTRVDMIAAGHGARIVGVFGSVARNEETPQSDLDLLVELPEDAGLFSLWRMERELADLLGCPVDLVPASDLKDSVRPAVEADLIPW